MSRHGSHVEDEDIKPVFMDEYVGVIELGYELRYLMFEILRKIY